MEPMVTNGNRSKHSIFQRWFGWRHEVSDYFERMDIYEEPVHPKEMKKAERMVEVLSVLVVLLFLMMAVGSIIIFY